MIKKTAQTTKQIAKKAFQQVSREPFEILKTAGQQISGKEGVRNEEKNSNVSNDSQTPSKGEVELKKQTDAQKARRMEAFKREIEDIQNIEQQKKLQKQEEIKKDTPQPEKPAPQVSSKRGRRLRGVLGQIKKFAGLTGKERVKPPSG